MNPLFRLFSRGARPRFCEECGTPLDKVIEPGAGRFALETWTVLQCPLWPRNGMPHYSHVIEWTRTASTKFDPMTGDPR